MDQDKLREILRYHSAWWNDYKGGKRANLSRADLSGVDLSDANLSRADLSRADLSGANLSRASLCGANLSGANLSGTNLSDAALRDANLKDANLKNANLKDANLKDANLNGAILNGANLNGANLSGANGLLSAVNYMEAHFERTEHGYIAYKTFGAVFAAPIKWKVKPSAVITENVNYDRCSDCGCGINVAPLDWFERRDIGEIWKVLIRWEWLCGVCVPYNTDGKIRCERVELVEKVPKQYEW